jgi:H+/gluconate symporter-like permease
MNWGPNRPFYGPQQPPWWFFAPPTTQPVGASIEEEAKKFRKGYKKGLKEYKKYLRWKEEEEKKNKPKDEKKPKLTAVQWTIVIAFLTITIGPWVAFLFTASMTTALNAIGAMLK